MYQLLLYKLCRRIYVGYRFYETAASCDEGLIYHDKTVHCIRLNLDMDYLYAFAALHRKWARLQKMTMEQFPFDVITVTNTTGSATHSRKRC